MSEVVNKKVFQILVDNTSGVLSRISGLFSRRGYNIESITAGVTAEPSITRITVVTSGDDDIMEQIEKQVGKLVDVRDIHELKPEESVFRELAMIKVRATADQRENVIALAGIFRGNIIDVSHESLMIEVTGNSGALNIAAFSMDPLSFSASNALTRSTDNTPFVDNKFFRTVFAAI